MLETLYKQPNKEKSIWLMRQAGRYLPEYRQVRSKFPSFIDFCLNPEASAEVTIQPLKRFALDAAIIFSDILIVPYALGIKVEFKENHGPVLDIVDSVEKLKPLNREVFYSVGKTIKLVKRELDNNFIGKSLIGFAGAPFTVASYMIEGGSSKDFKNILRFAYQEPEKFEKIIKVITDSTIEYIKIQIESGAQIIKIFDSWAGVLNESLFEKLVIEPTRRIVKEIKDEYPNIPIIGFARGVGTKLKPYALKTNMDCIAIDQYTPLPWVIKNITNVVIQGNLDNMLLAFGNRQQIKEQTLSILKSVQKRPHIFNLGHGVIPETPIDNVKFLVDIVKEYGSS